MIRWIVIVPEICIIVLSSVANLTDNKNIEKIFTHMAIVTIAVWLSLIANATV